jgi:F0F1-type ATP synthase alpha subunit
MYYQGMRPAVNIPLSVTRVGRQTLDKLTRDMNKNLTAFLAQYDKLMNLSHFGQELTDDVKQQLRVGELIYEFFKQPYQMTIPLNVQLIIISLIWQAAIIDKEMLTKVKTGLIAAHTKPEEQKYFADLTGTPDMKSFNEKVINDKDKLMAFAG